MIFLMIQDSKHTAMNSLKILSIYDCLYLRKAKFMLKVYNNITPKYITENFTLRNNEDTSIKLRSFNGVVMTYSPVCFCKLNCEIANSIGEK